MAAGLITKSTVDFQMTNVQAVYTGWIWDKRVIPVQSKWNKKE